MIITIDGKVATGKSTVARSLAKAIAYIYFDTGAMYRALTYAALRQGISPSDREKLTLFLKDFSIAVKVIFGERQYWIGEEDVTTFIRSKAVTDAVSQFSAIKEVRDTLVAVQRELAKGVNAVFEGRDMGTVVFPKADLKIFLTGDPYVRAQRRFEEIVSKYPEQAQGLTLEQCYQSIHERDEYDSTREIAPLHQAEDSHLIDTTHVSVEEVVYRIQELIEKI